MSALHPYLPPASISVAGRACAVSGQSSLRRLLPSIDPGQQLTGELLQHCPALPATTMGNESSLPLDMCATFDAEEIKRLGKRWEPSTMASLGSWNM